jgi:hypothetical protein
MWKTEKHAQPAGRRGQIMNEHSLYEVIAHHEAGHAVIARVLGVSFDYVTMDPADGAEAHVKARDAIWQARDADLPAQLKALATDGKMALAGPYAQMRYEPDASAIKALKEFSIPVDAWGDMNWVCDMKKISKCVAWSVLLRTHVCSSLSECEGVHADAAECKGLYDQLGDETEKLVAENWPAIERVAKQLKRQPTLTQIEVDALIAD